MKSRAAEPGEAAKTKKNNARRPLEEKKSRHWVETAQEAKAVLSAAAMVTLIADREADLYAMWASIPGPNVHVLGQIRQVTDVRVWPVTHQPRRSVYDVGNRPWRDDRSVLRID